MLARCEEVLAQLLRTIDGIFGDAGYGAAVAAMAAHGVPQALGEEASAARSSLLLLAEFATELGSAELAGLRAEGKMTQRFRAPQTLGVLTAADALVCNVEAAAQSGPVSGVSVLREGRAEAAAMIGTAGVDDDELDDAI